MKENDFRQRSKETDIQLQTSCDQEQISYYFKLNEINYFADIDVD